VSQPWKPVLGGWVTTVGTYGGTTALVVGIQSLPQATTPYTIATSWGAAGPWARPGTTWLPGWRGRCSSWQLDELRPATLDEVARVQLDQLTGAGL
jgi:hypothetical protein